MKKGDFLKYKWMIVLCLCLLLPQIVFAASIKSHRFESFQYEVIAANNNSPQILRIEIGLNSEIDDYEVKTKSSYATDLIIEFPNTKLGRLKKPLAIQSDLVKIAKFNQENKDTATVSLTLPVKTDNINYKIYTLPKDRKARKPFRVVIDILGEKSYNFNVNGVAGKSIIIDPGHGGSDSGAVGVTGVKEKDVNFAVALKVRDILTHAGAAVIMTRLNDRDVYGPNATDKQELDARADFSRRYHADAFLSIHSNSFVNSKANGTETYYYNKTIYDKILAENLQRSLIDSGQRMDRGALTANFYVLKNSTVPAALVELGFLSNPDEEELLNSDDFQTKLAGGISVGLSKFFYEMSGKGSNYL